MSAVTEGARRERGAATDGGSAQTPSARSPAPASRVPVRPSVQPRLHRLGTRRPRRPPADPASRRGRLQPASTASALGTRRPRRLPADPAHRRRGERAPVGRSASRGEGQRWPALRGGTAAAAAEGRGGTGERELRPAGARAEGRNGGGPRRGEERRRPLRRGGGASGQREDEEGAIGLSGKAREAPPSELVRL